MQIDKEGANIERVKQEMSENGLLPEEWGGETPMVAVRFPVHCTAVQSNSGARPRSALPRHGCLRHSCLTAIPVPMVFDPYVDRIPLSGLAYTVSSYHVLPSHARACCQCTPSACSVSGWLASTMLTTQAPTSLQTYLI